MEEQSIKEKRGFFERKKYSKDENLRFAALVLAVVILIGLFVPFTGLKIKLTAYGGVEEKKEITIIDPDSSIVEIDLIKLITKENLGGYKIMGIKLNDIQLFGINLYGLLTTPFPDFSGLKKVNSAINSGALDFMVSEEFITFCNTYLGDSAENVIALGQALKDMSVSDSDALDQTIDILNSLNKGSEAIRKVTGTIEYYLGMIGNGVLLVLAFALLGILLFYFDKGPKWIPKVILAVLTALLIGIGIAMAYVNNQVSLVIAEGAAQLSETIKSLIDSAVPNGSGMIGSLVGLTNVGFDLKLYLFFGLGWWLITLSLAACTVLSFVTPGMTARRLAEESGEGSEAAKDSAAPEEQSAAAEAKAVSKGNTSGPVYCTKCYKVFKNGDVPDICPDCGNPLK